MNTGVILGILVGILVATAFQLISSKTGAAVFSSFAANQGSDDTSKLPAPGSVHVLTDDNFDLLMSATPSGVIWAVDVYAPWCSHCKQLEPVWAQLAAELKDRADVRIAKIDGTQSRVLVSRFHIEGYPSIFILKDRRAWFYGGPRTLKAMREFIVSGHTSTDSLPPHRAPNSLFGRVLGNIHSLPFMIKEAYKMLKEKYKWSDLTILIAILAVPVVTGAITICAVDALFIRRGGSAETDETPRAAAVAAREGGGGGGQNGGPLPGG